ncbi:MAG: hypothetical protein Kow0029_23890 [Candidatus Rifleibacteriota bacterium]
MNRSGLTLLEIVLTLTLMSMLLAGVYKLNDARKETLKVIKSNTFAVFAIESLKNRILLMQPSGELSEKDMNALSDSVIMNENWMVSFSEDTKIEDGRKLTIKLYDKKSAQKRVYVKELCLNE